MSQTDIIVIGKTTDKWITKEKNYEKLVLLGAGYGNMRILLRLIDKRTSRMMSK